MSNCGPWGGGDPDCGDVEGGGKGRIRDASRGGDMEGFEGAAPPPTLHPCYLRYF